MLFFLNHLMIHFVRLGGVRKKLCFITFSIKCTSKHGARFLHSIVDESIGEYLAILLTVCHTTFFKDDE